MSASLEVLDGGRLLRPVGRWQVAHADELSSRLESLVLPAGEVLKIDGSALETLDTAGAWLLYRKLQALKGEGVEVDLTSLRPEHRALLEVVAANDRPCPTQPPHEWTPRRVVAQVGRVTLRSLGRGKELLAFFGEAVLTFAGTVLRPWRLRFTSLVFHMEEVGFNALPIVGLISFLIGVVLAFQGATQLRQFGAEVFVVDLLAISILREIGILLTAIVVAGRSGSAFTAQLGSMKVREEVDALRTLGLDPMEVLVLPRALALVLTLPLLAFFADMMGLLGGGLMCWIGLDISPALFLQRLQAAIGGWDFWTGIIKAPVFAALIALVGCFEGFQVSGSAESVGRQTTRSVVESIFLVIVVDAFFSVFFSVVGI